MRNGDFLLNKNYRLYFGDQYDSMPVLLGNGPMVEGLLNVLAEILSKALTDYGKVFAFRFDLRMPSDCDASSESLSNSCASRFVASLKAKISHNRGVVRKHSGVTHDTSVRYFWVREVGDEGRVHYHFAVLLNGHAFNWLGCYGSLRENMANRVCSAWSSALGVDPETAKALVHFPENPTYIMFRGDPSSIDAFFRRASYMCKARTKQHSFGHHVYGSSRN